MGLISVREGCRPRASFNSSSSDLAVMKSTVRWISRASPDMELGFTNAWRILRDVVKSLSDSQIWLPSHVSAMTRDGSRNGSSRSIRVSDMRATLTGLEHTLKSTFKHVEF